MMLGRRKTKPSSVRQRLRGGQSELRGPLRQSFTYHGQRSEQRGNTGRAFRHDILAPAAQKAGSFWVQRFGLGILLVVLAVCAVNVLRLSSDVRLEQLGPVNRSSLFHHQSDYQRTLNQLLSDSLLNHNKITVNTSELSLRLLSAYPELSSATVTIPLLSHRPTLYISYTEPALILHNQTGSYVIDTDGKTLAPTSSEAVALGLPTVADQSGFVLASNKQVLASADVRFIQQVVAGLKAKQVTTGELTLPPAANELDVAIAGQPYYVKFNLHATGANLQIGSFLAVQQHLAGRSTTPGKYIDVRVDGRAYYQ
ncbi:MAG: hypothetical protein ABIV43_03490 [Candidatus Saccharimonadales bacterium]